MGVAQTKTILTGSLTHYIMKNSIKVERAKKDMTQQDLADKVQVSRQTINSIEAGKYVPSTVLALKIAKVFGVGLEDIFELEESDFS
jgi:putative transcriptional regulator